MFLNTFSIVRQKLSRICSQVVETEETERLGRPNEGKIQIMLTYEPCIQGIDN